MKDEQLNENRTERKAELNKKLADSTNKGTILKMTSDSNTMGIIQKKAGVTLFTLAAALMLMFGSVFTGCESNQEKVADAQEDVIEAKEDLAEVKKEVARDAQEKASDEDWRVFKNDAEVKIRDNEARIKKMRDERGNNVNDQYAKDIEALEKRNRDLQTRIDTYNRDEGNWESFKREFKHDMDSFGQAFRDLVEDNKK